MLSIICTTITSVDLAHYGISRAKNWVSVDCGTNKVTTGLPGQAHNAATKLVWKYGFDSLLFLSSGLLTLISKKSVASLYDAYYEVRSSSC